jgi:hypothetical protein
MDEVSELQPVAEEISQASAAAAEQITQAGNAAAEQIAQASAEIAKEASRTGCTFSDAGCCISDCLSNPCFWYGAAAGAILLLLVIFIVWAIRRSRARMDAVIVRDEGGDFAITRKALKGFLAGVVSRVSGVSLKCLELVRRKGKCDLDLCLTAAAGANLVEAHKSLRTLVRDEVRIQLGLDECLGDVNFRFVSIPVAKEDAEATAPADEAAAQDDQPNA